MGAYGRHNYMGEHASDAAALTFIRACHWDSDGDGSGSPSNGMLYYNTTSHGFLGYQDGSWEALGGGTTPVFGNGYNRVASSGRSTTTSNSFGDYHSHTTAALAAGNYLFRATLYYDTVMMGGTGEGSFRLYNSTNSAVVGPQIQTNDPLYAACQLGTCLVLEGVITFAGAAKTIKMQYRTEDSGGMDECSMGNYSLVYFRVS